MNKIGNGSTASGSRRGCRLEKGSGQPLSVSSLVPLRVHRKPTEKWMAEGGKRPNRATLRPLTSDLRTAFTVPAGSSSPGCQRCGEEHGSDEISLVSEDQARSSASGFRCEFSIEGPLRRSNRRAGARARGGCFGEALHFESGDVQDDIEIAAEVPGGGHADLVGHFSGL